LGYEESELIGHPIWKFVAPAERVLSRLAVERKIAGQQPLGRFEREYVRKDGGRIFVEIHESLIHDAAGTVTGIRMALLDVTDRRRAAAGLRDSERRFRLLVEGVRDCALFLLAADGSVTSWNEGAARIHGYSVEEAVGRHFSWLFPMEEIQKGDSERVLRSAAEHGSYESEGWRVHKDHGRFWGRLDVQALRDESGRVEGFAVVTRDLTELRQAQEKLDAYAGELRQKSRELSDLIGAVREAWHADASLTMAGLPVAGWERAVETPAAQESVRVLE
jgi:PAS domain S-box-containing protein